MYTEFHVHIMIVTCLDLRTHSAFTHAQSSFILLAYLLFLLNWWSGNPKTDLSMS